MTTIEITEMSEMIDGIEYAFFIDTIGPAFRVIDSNSGEQVSLMHYPTAEKAQDAYRTAAATAWQFAANMRN